MSAAPLTTPVALFIFNRPDTTARVFEAIRRARPQRLLLVADGARPGRPGEAERCAAARAVVARVDWECQVTTHYADSNLGCRQRISSGLRWVFEQAEEAIVLEDDCLPADSFFLYCQTLLARYRDDERIFLISGDNFLGERGRNSDSYYFTKYSYIWGWASWRRAFRLYDVDMKGWPEFRASRAFRDIAGERDERKFWRTRFDQAHSGAVDTWDYQMMYSLWVNGKLAIAPERNLISNIGFSNEGTHPVLDDDATNNLPVSDIWNVVHPAQVERDVWADRFMFERVYKGRMRRVVQHFKRGYEHGGLVGLARAAVDLAQRTRKLIMAR